MLTFHPILEPEEHWGDLLDKEVIYLGDEASPMNLLNKSGRTRRKKLGQTDQSASGGGQVPPRLSISIDNWYNCQLWA